MPISYQPMRDYMKEHGISYYYLANAGIDAGTLQRIRQDLPVTTKTLGYICKIMRCQYLYYSYYKINVKNEL